MRRKLIVDVAEACNNGCAFCASEKKGRRTPQSYAKEILAAGAEGFTDIDFSGSEPTMSRHTIPLISLAKKAGFKSITLFTNGRIFSRKNNLASFVAAGMSKVIFSVYSYNDSLHDQITRVNGSFAEVSSAIKNALSIPGLEVGASITLLKDNSDDLMKTIQWLNNSGVQFITLSPALPSVFNTKRTILLEKNAMPDASALFGLASIKNLKATVFPVCETDAAQSSFLQKEVRVIRSDGTVANISKMMKAFTYKDEACTACDSNKSCQGHIRSSANKKFHTTWAISDLHFGKDNPAASKIFADAELLHFDRALFLGDLVEGELDPSSYDHYLSGISSCSYSDKISSLAGNHDYLYNGKTPSLKTYKVEVSEKLNHSFTDGNLHTIMLSQDEAPMKISESAIAWVKEEINKNKDKIILLATHSPPDSIGLKDLRGVDLWVYGHSRSFGEDVHSENGTHHIFCSPKNGSKFLIFEDGESSVTVLRRDHANHVFFKEEALCLDKVFRKNG